MSSLPPTRRVLVRKEPHTQRDGSSARTQHEMDCRFIARRVRNEPGIIAAQYDEMQAGQVTVPTYKCKVCSPTVT
jgi:hypothetical protein